MKKVTLGPSTLVCPMPVLLVGANVNNRPNFMVVAWGGIAGGTPPMISVAIRHQRYTLIGIRQNMAFSVNLPSVDLMREADYCGIVSGAKVDKVAVCQFKVFYGKLGNAPLIEQCPVNLECKVMHLINLGSHFLVVGRIDETHVSQDCLTDGQPDIDKINSITYISTPYRQYRSLGEVIGKGHVIGQELKARE